MLTWISRSSFLFSGDWDYMYTTTPGYQSVFEAKILIKFQILKHRKGKG
jgi:hypothetical protein